MSAWSGLYNKTVKTRRGTRSASSRSAAGAITWADNLTGQAVAIQPLTARERELYAKLTPTVELKMFIDGTPDILARDVVVDEDDATQYEVVGPANDQAGRGEVSVFLLRRFVES